jgi:hypothetical protein
MATSLSRIRPHHVARALNPITTGDSAKSEPIITIVSLAVALVLLNTWKGQVTPDLSNVGKDVLLVIGLVAIGTVAPTVVTGVLLVALLFWVLTNQPAVTDLVRRVVSQTPGA